MNNALEESAPIVVGTTGIELPSDTDTANADVSQLQSQTTGNSPDNNNQLQVMSYFPSAVYSIVKPEFLSPARKVATEFLMKRKKEQPRMDPIYPLYQTENMFNDPRIAEFCQYVGATAWNILNGQGFAMADKSVFFMELWTQEHYKHSAMDEHTHGYGAQLVGFYFLETPPDCSRIIIHDPRPAKKQINLPEADMGKVTYGSNAINFTPEPGLLFFANSWLPHQFSRHANNTKPIRFIHFTIGVKQNDPSTVVSKQAAAPAQPASQQPTNGPVIV
jgi:hypothetical protein